MRIFEHLLEDAAIFRLFGSQLAISVEHCQLRLQRDFCKHLDMLLTAEGFDVISGIQRFIDDDAERFVVQLQKLDTDAHIVGAKDGGFGDQNTHVSLQNALYYMAGISRGTIQDLIGKWAGLCDHPTDNGAALHLTRIQASRYDMYMFKISGADRTYVIRMFNNCLLRTQQTAAAAVMAEIVKDNHLAAGISQRMKRTEIDAGAAAVAPIGLHRRNHDIDRFKTCPIHGQEQMAIGDFYITVNIGGMILNISKIYTDKGLASASFSTQYCYFHVLYFLFCVSKPRLGRTMRVRAFVCKVSFSSLKKDLPLYKKRQVR